MPRPKMENYETEDWLIRIRGWARDGLNEEQISYNMGISQSSLKRWKKESEPIRSALKESKEVADRRVENSLFKTAMGYNYDEVTEERKFNPVTQQFEMVVTKIVHKTLLPQHASQIFWLKNRKPDEWRDKRIIEDHIDFEDDGFIDALKGQAKDTFSDESVVEE